MSQLALYLLGPPRVERDGESLKIAGRKAVALLAYLAIAGERPAGVSHSRDALATLLWPNSDQSHARGELRRALSSLRRSLGKGWLKADRETVALRHVHDDRLRQAQPDSLHLVQPESESEPWLDVDAFRERLAWCETHGHAAKEMCGDCVSLLEGAVALYRGDFMAGFTLRDSLAFDEWQFFQAEELRQG